MNSGVMVTMKLRKVNWIRAKMLQRRYFVNRMCSDKRIVSHKGRKGMFKIYDYLYKFCLEISDVYG